MKKFKDYDLVILVECILFIILFVILYLISIGKFELGEPKNLTIEEKRKKAKEEHDKNEALLKERIKLKNRIEKRRVYIYLGIRVLIFLTWLGINLFVHISYNKDIKQLLVYNDIAVLAFVWFIFLCIGEITSIKEIGSYLRNVIDNRLYKFQYASAIIDIEHLNTKQVALAKELNS